MMKHWIILMVSAAVLAGGWYWMADRTEKEVVFFSHALSLHDIAKIVEVDGIQYAVSGGAASLSSGERARGRNALDALKVAYAAALAERSPIFGLAGSDPNRVEEYALLLGEVADALADAQEARPGAEDIAAALYPVSFLTSLADTERLRRQFLQAPSDTSSEAYADALQETIDAYERDLRAFISAFERQVGEATAYRVLGGLVTKQSFLQAAQDSLERIRGIRGLQEDREACMGGGLERCASRDLSLPIIQQLPEIASGIPDPFLLEEIRSIYERAAGASVSPEGAVIALHASACVPAFPDQPYFFLKHAPGEKDFMLGGSLRFMNDLFSYETPPLTELFEKNASPAALSREPRVLFALYQPTAYYQCPELGADISRAHATRSSYRQLDLPGLREVRGYPVFEESAARAGIQSVLETAFSRQDGTDQYEELRAAARMFADNSAGLEEIMEEIVFNQRSAILQYQAGRSADIDANWQFAVKSGFSSLFLLHHRTMGNASISIFSERSTGLENMGLLQWSTLRGAFPREKLARDLETFLLMHTDPMGTNRKQAR